MYLKSKFFLYRLVTYFSFLLFPIWIQKTTELNKIYLMLLMLLYIAFMGAQWFLLGKEIDHRLKIYFRVNSSIDRIIYRLILGMSFAIFYFNLLALLPYKWSYNSFWFTWAVLGLFYSWPSRGKIIQESVSSNFSEYKHLDSFEKTVLFLVILIFIISFPGIPKLDNYDALKLYFDPDERISNFFWSFLSMNYLPFRRYPELFRVAMGMHFYFVVFGLFLLTFYGLLRYFLCRRLGLLGVFALLSSWSFSKFIFNNYPACIQASIGIFFVWSMMWAIKSASYRSGLFFGMIGFLLTIFDAKNLSVYAVGLGILLIQFLNEKTFWFRKQFLKYNIIGIVLIILVLVFKDFATVATYKGFSLFPEVLDILQRKAFFTLSWIGLPLAIAKILADQKVIFKSFHIPREKLIQFILCILILLASSKFLGPSIGGTLALMAAVTVFSLIPLELVFQTMARVRSQRNIIYLLYILICLLDSHFEGRVKIFIKFIDS